MENESAIYYYNTSHNRNCDTGKEQIIRTAIGRRQSVRRSRGIEIRHRSVHVGVTQIRTRSAQRVFDDFV